MAIENGYSRNAPRCFRRCRRMTPSRFDGNRVVHFAAEGAARSNLRSGRWLFKYCFDHAWAECPTCRQDLPQSALDRNFRDAHTPCPRGRSTGRAGPRASLYLHAAAGRGAPQDTERERRLAARSGSGQFARPSRRADAVRPKLQSPPCART